MKNELTKLPNIGKILAEKLEKAGIVSADELKQMGSEKALLKIAASQRDDVCIDMLYALEGAIQGIRWHGLDPGRKQELLHFYRTMEQQE